MRILPLLIVLSACGARATPASLPRATAVHRAPALFAATPDHGDMLVRARDAVRDGEVADALAQLRPLLGDAVAADVPPELAVYVHGLASEALDLDHVRGLEGGARTVGAAAAWCGRCHRAAHVPTPAAPAFDEHPYRRLADGAWRALVWPEGPDWDLLAATLAPFRADAIPEDAEAPLAVIGRALRDVPPGAEGTVGMAERIDVFAKVQASCEACHREPEEDEAEPLVAEGGE